MKKPKKFTGSDARALPVSHVTYGQCSRLVGVENMTVRHRVAAGHITPIEIAGVKMIGKYYVAEWIEERAARE